MRIEPGIRISSQLWAAQEGGPWTEAAIWPNDGLPTDGLIFEVDEPVMLADFRPGGTEFEGAVFYIAEFRQDTTGHVALVGTQRGQGAFHVGVAQLVKLDPLRRLAAEGA